MDRHCKNCGSNIYASKSYCADCGAKWIDNRITFKQVAADFSDNYIGLDTKFIRTFVDLFKKPEAVILGYINGRRVNYMDAVRYLLLAIFVTGVYTFILKQTGVIEDIMNRQIEATMDAYRSMGMSEEQVIESIGQANKISKQVFEFQGFILLLTIPLLALAARITFYGRRYFNFTEQIVFHMYTYSHFVISSTPLTILIVFTEPNYFPYVGLVTFPLLYIYNAFCYKKSFNLSNSTVLAKSLISIIVLLGVMAVTGILLAILGIIVGILLKVTGVL